MSLTTPPTVGKLQAALHGKAKAEPGYRFYLLYDKLYRKDVLAHAYACCRENRSAAGVDHQTFEDIEAYGRERWLGELAVSRVYRAVDEQARRRLRQGWRAKYPHHGYGRPSYPAAYLHEVLGLVRLQGRPRTFPCARA